MKSLFSALPVLIVMRDDHEPFVTLAQLECTLAHKQDSEYSPSLKITLVNRNANVLLIDGIETNTKFDGSQPMA